MVASELSELLAAHEELQNQVLILEQQLGLAPSDAVITHVNPEYLTITYGTLLIDVASLLPTSVRVVLDDETTNDSDIIWQLDSAEYYHENTGTYEFYGYLVLDELVVNPEELQAVAYVTIPAYIWLNIEGNRNYSLAGDSMGYSHDVVISNLTGNKEFTIEFYNENGLLSKTYKTQSSPL